MANNTARRVNFSILAWGIIRTTAIVIASVAAEIIFFIEFRFGLIGDPQAGYYKDISFTMIKVILPRIIMAIIWYLVFLAIIKIFPFIQYDFERDPALRWPLIIIGIILGFFIGDFLIQNSIWILAQLFIPY
jgi:hypothetical protein